MPRYIKKSSLEKGYNPYLMYGSDDMGTGMDVGILVMENGDTWTYRNTEKEMSALLFEGSVTFEWEGREVKAERPDCFHHEAYCLLMSRNKKLVIRAHAHSEIYIQATVCENDYEPVMFTPDTVQVQHAGASGELKGCMERMIKTFYDYDNAPFSNMVLGEVLNLPGRWSSYPPHHHPQPEVYFYRFDYPNGFGAGFANGEIYKTEHNGLAVITEGFHSQVTAPGFAMCYAWGIRHLPGDPWKKTRIDDKGYEWLWKPDANSRIYPEH